MIAGNGQIAVETRQLVKRFGRFTAVDRLDLSIQRGETYGMLGPNGSGKTTAIKMLCGLLKPTSGEALVLGEKAGHRSVRPRVGYMPQDIALYVDLTVHDNIRLYGEIYGMSRGDIEREEHELLSFVDLEEWRNASISTLSGGMQHRVSLACSLLHRPEVLFLDEPTVGVDPELRASFWEYFEALRERGVTVIITTHYMDEANNCSRIGLLRNGQLIAEGSPREVVESAGAANLEEAFLRLAQRRQS